MDIEIANQLAKLTEENERLNREITIRKNIEQELIRRNHELMVLQASTMAVTSSLDIHRVLDSIVLEMVNLLKADICRVLDWQEVDDTLVVIAAYSRNSLETTNQIGHFFLLEQHPLLKNLLEEEEVSLIRINQPDLTPNERQYLEQAHLKSLLLVPMVYQDRVIGLVELAQQKKERIFVDQEVGVVYLLASQAAAALENARLYNRSQQEIAERKRVEQALHERTIELQSQNAELDAFAQTVAHDLKNPIGALLGIAEILAKDHQSLAIDELSYYLNSIVKSGRKANNIIKELLLLAGVRKKTIELKPVEMTTIVAEACERLDYMAQEHNAEIILPPKWPLAMGYAPWVEEIWSNYLSNGMKYGGLPPVLTLGATPQSNGDIKFWVRDNGPGLTIAQQKELFTPFTKLSTTRSDGHGLGLSIVRRIVEKLGGEAGVDSIPNRGSNFWFTLAKVDHIEE